MNWLKAILRAVFAMPPGGIKPGWPVVPPVPKPVPQPPLPPHWGSIPPDAEDILRAVNAARRGHGVAPLAYHPKPQVIATGHAKAMAISGDCEHQGIGDGTFGQRLASVGLSGYAAAENIGQGYRDADSVVDGWLNSTMHRANLLGMGYTHFGGGMARGERGDLFWCGVFIGAAQ